MIIIDDAKANMRYREIHAKTCGRCKYSVEKADERFIGIAATYCTYAGKDRTFEVSETNGTCDRFRAG
ncbi:hypothetical protein KAR91_72740 [Candidatus Pacearchaeota archaeon]|nr:hypothetical protein [Candidatus Pacearchaeota archaeon]